MRGFLGVMLGVGLAGSVGCGLTLDTSPPDPALDGAGFDGGPGVDAPGTDAGVDTGPDAPPVDTGSCETAEDCPVPVHEGCVAQCLEGACVPADLDEDGFGPGCERPDCDDLDPSIGDRGLLSCDDGAVGACAAGAFRVCVDGAISECVGARETRPAGERPEDGCNGIDDDCDGSIDEDATSRMSDFAVTEGCRVSVACVDGRWQSSGLIGRDVLDDTLDGADDDCDGAIDEDFVPEGGDCVFVFPEGRPDSANPTRPGDPLPSIGAALERMGEDPGLPRTICLLNYAERGACEATEFAVPEGRLPLGVTIIGSHYFPNEVVGILRCPPRSSHLVLEGSAGPLEWDPVRSLGPGPTGLRNVLVENFRAQDAIRVEGIPRTREVALEEVVVVQRTAGGHGLFTGDARVRLAQSRVQGAGSSAAIFAHEEAVANIVGCIGPSCRCPLQGSVQAPTGAPGLEVEGSAIAVLTNATVCSNTAEPAATVFGAELYGIDAHLDARRLNVFESAGGAGAALVVGTRGEVALIGGAVDNTPGDFGIAVHVFEESQLVLHDVDVTNQVGVRSAGSVGVECDGGSACYLLQSRVTGGTGADGGMVRSPIALRCADDATCSVVESELLGTRSGNASAAEGIDAEGASLFVERSRIVGGCGTQSVGIASGGSFTHVENSEVRGRLACDVAMGDGFGIGVKVAAGEAGAGVFNSVYNSFDAGETCGDGFAFEQLGATETYQRGTLYGSGELCNATAASWAEPPVLLVTNAFVGPIEVARLRGSPFSDVSELEALSSAYFLNVSTDGSIYASRPADLRVRAGSDVDGAGGPGAPATDLPGTRRPADAPTIGCYEP